VSKVNSVRELVSILVNLPPHTSYQFTYDPFEIGRSVASIKKAMINGVNRTKEIDPHAKGRKLIYSVTPVTGRKVIFTVTHTRIALFKKLGKSKITNRK
jgi:hypothetical protein